jgi:tRNA(Ile)-lysidine synthase
MILPAEHPPGASAPIDLLRICERLNRMPGVGRFHVGLSGGLDSSVLLHILHQARPATELRAIHVNHGLRPEAGQWARNCIDLCGRYGIEIEVLNVDAHPARGESPEAAAREARYGAIERLLAPGDCLLTAHHRDDQAETLLLQLLRGGGPAGLAAMPELAPFGPGWHLRPLLVFDRNILHQYATAAGLEWIEDDSNSELRYDRNFLRREIMPLLRGRWPALTQTLARAALHQAEAAELLEALAGLDFPQVHDPLRGTLAVSRLKLLSPARLHNVLRHWCRLHAALPPSAAVLQQIVGAIGAADDRTPQVAWGSYEIRRHGNDLYLLDRITAPLADEYVWHLRNGGFSIPELKLKLYLPDLLAAGLKLPEATETLHIRFRDCGERITLQGRDHTHSLKKILQERTVPPWMRSRLPLLYDEAGRLLAVLGLEPPIFAAPSAEHRVY